eukprot:g1166.t1
MGSSCSHKAGRRIAGGCGAPAGQPQGEGTLQRPPAQPRDRPRRSRAQLPGSPREDSPPQELQQVFTKHSIDTGHGRDDGEDGQRRVSQSLAADASSAKNASDRCRARWASNMPTNGGEPGGGRPCNAPWEKGEAQFADAGGAGGRREGAQPISFDPELAGCGRGGAEDSVNYEEKNDIEPDYELIMADETDENYHDDFTILHLKDEEKNYMVNLTQDHFMDLEDEIYACGGLREEDRLDVLELCCEENSLLADTINKMGGKAERAGLFNGCDILKVEGRERIRFHKKPWTVRSSRSGVFELMERKCNGSHTHVPLEGGCRTKKSALYTTSMCRTAAKCILDNLDTAYDVFGVETIKIDRESLKTMTAQELERLTVTVMKLHRRCGHPSNRALVRTLAARNADGKMLAIAEQLKRDECQEGQFSPPMGNVSLEKEEKIWNTLQMDVMFYKHGTNVHHFLIMLDEASGFSISAELMVRTEDLHANVDTPSVIEALEGSWFQYFGQPSRIRCNLEGAFRGRDLEAFCAERGIELLQVPAEHHQSTGDVERQIGELRHKVELFLRNEDVPPRRAVYSMTSAHNNMRRIGGYSPSQWAFGRQVDNADNVAMHSSEGTSDTAMSQNLELRLRAEKKYLELQAKAKISRALNSKTKISSRFLPGDLVYYKRYKVSQDFPAHNLVDQPRLRISRWYGPGRVLATETRLQEQGTRRVAASTIWVVSQGRLKKFHVDQLRHTNERERLTCSDTSMDADGN